MGAPSDPVHPQVRREPPCNRCCHHRVIATLPNRSSRIATPSELQKTAVLTPAPPPSPWAVSSSPCWPPCPGGFICAQLHGPMPRPRSIRPFRRGPPVSNASQVISEEWGKSRMPYPSRTPPMRMRNRWRHDQADGPRRLSMIAKRSALADLHHTTILVIGMMPLFTKGLGSLARIRSLLRRSPPLRRGEWRSHHLHPPHDLRCRLDAGLATQVADRGQGDVQARRHR